MQDFDIDGLDHVAIRVIDMERSAAWYSRVLGLKPYKLEAWGAFPVFLLSGRTGIALFPADSDDPQIDAHSKNVKIDHFAFSVTLENFERAREKYNSLNLEYQFKDHTHYHSLYTRDPDGHVVELTTLVADFL